MTREELLQNLKAMQARISDPRPALRAIADLMIASVDQNFAAQGRPNRWKEVTKTTRRLKDAAGKGNVLTWSGRLASTVVPQVLTDKVVLGSNWPSARIHNQGGTIKRAGKSGSVRLRTNAKGQLLRQGQEGRSANLAVFARGGHKRAVERAFTHGAYEIHMPARPYLIYQPGEPEQYGALVMHYVQTGRIEVPA